MTQDVDFDKLVSESYGDRVDDLDQEGYNQLEETFEKKYEKFGDEKLALTSAIGSFNFEQNKGDSEEVLIYAVGTDFSPQFQGGTLFCYGVLDDGDRSGRIVALVKGDDTDTPTSELREMWGEFGNPINATLDIRSTDVLGTFVGEITTMDGDVFHEAEEVERSQPEIEEFIHEHVPKTEISNVSEGLTTTQTDNPFPVEFGVDFRRLEYATVLESNIGKSARYILQDDSFLEASELDGQVRGEDNEVGLEAYADRETMTVSTESIADVYGMITPTQNGMVNMDIIGYDGHYVQEADVEPVDDSRNQSSGGSSEPESSASSQAIDERTI